MNCDLWVDARQRLPVYDKAVTALTDADPSRVVLAFDATNAFGTMPRQRIWDAIYEAETWPRWWKGVKETTELAPGDDDGLGIGGQKNIDVTPGQRLCRMQVADVRVNGAAADLTTGNDHLATVA